MNSKPPGTYQCAMCHGVFERAVSDEEAKKEYEELFPDFQGGEMDIVCDDCFQKIDPRKNQEDEVVVKYKMKSDQNR